MKDWRDEVRSMLPAHVSPDRVDQVVELWGKGYSRTEIREIAGIRFSTTAQIVGAARAAGDPRAVDESENERLRSQRAAWAEEPADLPADRRSRAAEFGIIAERWFVPKVRPDGSTYDMPITLARSEFAHRSIETIKRADARLAVLSRFPPRVS